MPHQCTDCGRQFEDGSKEMLSGCPDCGGNKFQFLPDGAATEDAADSSVTAVRDPPDRDKPGSTVARTVGSAATAVRDLVGSSDSSPEPGAPADAGAGAPPERTTDRKPSASATEPSVEGARRSPPPAASDDRTHEPTSAQTTTRTSPDQPTENPTTGRPERSGGVESGPDHRESTRAAMADSENAAQASARSEVVSPDELPSGNTSRARSRAAEEWSRSVQETEQQQQTETDRPDLSELREELNQQFESIKVREPGQYELNLMELFDREEYIIALQEDGKYTVQVPEHWQE